MKVVAGICNEINFAKVWIAPTNRRWASAADITYKNQVSCILIFSDTVIVSQKSRLSDFCYFMVTKFAFQKLRLLQLISTFGNLKNLRYSIYIQNQKGESEPMDLPFVLSQSPNFGAFDLTQDLRMR